MTRKWANRQKDGVAGRQVGRGGRQASRWGWQAGKHVLYWCVCIWVSRPWCVCILVTGQEPLGACVYCAQGPSFGLPESTSLEL